MRRGVWQAVRRSFLRKMQPVLRLARTAADLAKLITVDLLRDRRAPNSLLPIGRPVC